MLTNVSIGDSVTSIDNSAFNGCKSLTSVYITDIAAWCNISFSSDGSNPLYYAGNLYLNGELVTELVIPDSVKSIGDYAFYNCTSLTSVSIGDSVTHIGWGAFYKCTSLKSVTFKNTSGWYVTKTLGASSGIYINVAGAGASNAITLTSSHYNYYWYRSES